jgi:hypothetical protein
MSRFRSTVAIWMAVSIVGVIEFEDSAGAGSATVVRREERRRLRRDKPPDPPPKPPLPIAA